MGHHSLVKLYNIKFNKNQSNGFGVCIDKCSDGNKHISATDHCYNIKRKNTAMPSLISYLTVSCRNMRNWMLQNFKNSQKSEVQSVQCAG
jgi:hypothetical protein